VANSVLMTFSVFHYQGTRAFKEYKRSVGCCNLEWMWHFTLALYKMCPKIFSLSSFCNTVLMSVCHVCVPLFLFLKDGNSVYIEI
jgi:hypothetical protein